MGPQTPQPVQPQDIDPAQKAKDEAIEKECMDRIQYQLKRYHCVLVPEMVLSPGQVGGRVAINKVPEDVWKQMNGDNPGTPTPSGN